MKRYCKWLVVLIFICSLSSCQKQKVLETEKTQSNTAITRTDNPITQRNANFMNGSYLVKDKNWIYYIGSNGYGLYKMKIDGSEYIDIDKGSNLSHIILSGDRVYFFEHLNLVSIKNDGTDRKEIKAQYKGQNLLMITSNIQPTNDWIYFKGQPLPMQNNEETNLYKMKLDGSSTTLIHKGGIDNMNVTENAIYFTDTTKHNAIMRCNLDGSNLKQINEEYSHSIVVDGDQIYYLDEQNLLFRLDLTTKQNNQIGSDHIGIYNLIGEWIYYLNKNDHDHLYRMLLSGKQQEQINERVTGSILIYDDLIYYLNVSQGNMFFALSVDGKIHQWIGTNKISIAVAESTVDSSKDSLTEKFHTNNRVSSGMMDVWNGWLYVCLPVDEAYDLVRMQLDGSKMQMIESYTYLSHLSIIEDYVFYQHQSDRDSAYNGTLNKVSKDGKVRQDVINYPITDYLIQGDWIYFSSSDRFQKLLKQNLKTGEKFSIYNGVAGSINIVDGWIYFVNYSEKGYLYKVRTNGKEAENLVSEPVNSVIVNGDWIYYLNEKDEICRIKTDGTGQMLIGKNKIYSYNLTQKWIYFSNDDDRRYLYRMELDGSKPAKVNARSTDYICVFGEQVFYIGFGENQYNVYRLLPNDIEQKIYAAKNS
jgi:hypothetical protein